MAYEKTGVANYLQKLVEHLLLVDTKNEYVLFFSSMRKNFPSTFTKMENKRVTIKTFRLPPSILDLLWNKSHVAPIEWFIGDIDIFISSDWTQPPTLRAKKATIVYDSVVFKYPEETDQKIVATQKRKMAWSQKECDIFFCISESTKKDLMEILHIDPKKIAIAYPGV